MSYLNLDFLLQVLTILEAVALIVVIGLAYTYRRQAQALRLREARTSQELAETEQQIPITVQAALDLQASQRQESSYLYGLQLNLRSYNTSKHEHIEGKVLLCVSKDQNLKACFNTIVTMQTRAQQVTAGVNRTLLYSNLQKFFLESDKILFEDAIAPTPSKIPLCVLNMCVTHANVGMAECTDRTGFLNKESADFSIIVSRWLNK